MSDVLAVLASTAIVVDASDVVVSASASADAYGLVRRSGLVHEDVRRLVRLVRDDRVIREETLLIGRGSLDRPGGPAADQLVMGVRVAPLGDRHVLVRRFERITAVGDECDLAARQFLDRAC